MFTCSQIFINVKVLNAIHALIIFPNFLVQIINIYQKIFLTNPQKQETDETKIYLDQYCNKLSKIHNQLQPLFDFIIRKTVEVTKLTKICFLYNPYKKEEIQIKLTKNLKDLMKLNNKQKKTIYLLTLEEKVYTTHICDNLPYVNTNEALPQQYVKGTYFNNYYVDQNCQAANFIQSKA